MTYGYRRAPFGNQARVSRDRGDTWSAPIAISADGASGDLGYPSTVELAGGALLTVWYEQLAASPKAVLRKAILTASVANHNNQPPGRPPSSELPTGGNL